MIPCGMFDSYELKYMYGSGIFVKKSIIGIWVDEVVLKPQTDV